MSSISNLEENLGVINNLYDEFESEKNELRIKYDDNASKIEAIEENIRELMQYDDDTQMFSPRIIQNDNSEKIKELQKERDYLSGENDYIYSRLKYFKDKIDALGSVIQEPEQLKPETEGNNEENPGEPIYDNSYIKSINDQKDTSDTDDLDEPLSKSKIKKMVYRLKLANKLIEDNNIDRSTNEIDTVISMLSKYI